MDIINIHPPIYLNRTPTLPGNAADSKEAIDTVSSGSQADPSLDAMKKLAKLSFNPAEAVLGGGSTEISGKIHELWSVKQSGSPRADTIYDPVHKTVFTPMGNSNCPYLTALDSLGAIKWIYKEENLSPGSNTAIDGQGNAYFRTDRGVVALDPSGQKKWGFPVQSHCGTNETPIAVATDGTVYVTTVNVTGNMTLTALKEEKGGVREKWHFDTGNNVHNSHPISVGKDGTVFLAAREEEEHSSGIIFGSHKKVSCYRIIALDPDSGREKFKVDAAPRTGNKTFITSDDEGTVYVSHGVGYNNNMKVDERNRVSAFSKRGKEKWSYDVPQLPYVKDSLDRVYINQAPTVDRDGNIYVATDGTNNYPDGYLVKLDRKGHETWRITMNDDTFSTKPQIGPDGNIYVGTRKGMLNIYDGDGKLKNSMCTGKMFANNFSFGENGEVFLNVEGRVISVQPDLSKLSEDQLRKLEETEESGSKPEITVTEDEKFVMIDDVKLEKKESR